VKRPEDIWERYWQTLRAAPCPRCRGTLRCHAEYCDALLEGIDQAVALGERLQAARHDTRRALAMGLQAGAQHAITCPAYHARTGCTCGGGLP
jgi:hypothetical protein